MLRLRLRWLIIPQHHMVETAFMLPLTILEHNCIQSRSEPLIVKIMVIKRAFRDMSTSLTAFREKKQTKDVHAHGDCFVLSTANALLSRLHNYECGSPVSAIEEPLKCYALCDEEKTCTVRGCVLKPICVTF